MSDHVNDVNGSINQAVWDDTLVRKDLRTQTAASNLAFNEQVKALQQRGRRISHFAFGQSPFPVAACAVEALRRSAAARDYLPVAGTAELRHGIAAFHQRHDDLQLDAAQILVGPGSKELIYLTLAVFSGEVLLPAPAWTTYAPQSQLAGHRPTVLHTSVDHQYKLTAAQLERALSDRAPRADHALLVLTNPGNPSGVRYTESELAALAAVCRRRRVVVLSDEIYARLVFDGRHVSVAHFYPEATILVSGFSKWLSAGGWRLGYAHFPPALEPLRGAVRAAGSNTFSCAPAPVQLALAHVLQPPYAGQLDSYIGSCARVLAAVGRYCQRRLAEVGVTAPASQAGYYFLADFEVCRGGLAARGVRGGAQMVQTMLDEADVALMASSCFLMDDARLVTRFCFVCFDGAEALRSVEVGRQLDEEFVRAHCADLVSGVERLQQWVRKHTQ